MHGRNSYYRQVECQVHTLTTTNEESITCKAYNLPIKSASIGEVTVNSRQGEKAHHFFITSLTPLLGGGELWAGYRSFMNAQKQGPALVARSLFTMEKSINKSRVSQWDLRIRVSTRFHDMRPDFTRFWWADIGWVGGPHKREKGPFQRTRP